LWTVGSAPALQGGVCNTRLRCISSGSITSSVPPGSRPERSEILPNVTSAYCRKLYTQARAIFGFHLRLHACARTASRRSRYAATLPRQPPFGSPNGAHPRTSGAGSTTAWSRSQHRSAGCSRVAPGPYVDSISTDENRCETCRRLNIPIRDYLGSVLPGLADRPISQATELTPAAWANRK
jgi:hypothetical protein